jgi:hypothetical protein
MTFSLVEKTSSKIFWTFLLAILIEEKASQASIKDSGGFLHYGKHRSLLDHLGKIPVNCLALFRQLVDVSGLW